MDPRVREVIEGAMQNNASLLKGIEEANDNKMGSVLETCFSKNDSNPERFAECIVEKQKKMEDILNPMQFKIMFFSKRKSVSECTQQATKGIREVIENTRKSIDRL